MAFKQFHTSGVMPVNVNGGQPGMVELLVEVSKGKC